MAKEKQRHAEKQDMIAQGKYAMIAIIVFLSIGFIVELIYDGMPAGRLVISAICALLLFAIMQGITWARYTLAVLLVLPTIFMLLFVVIISFSFGGGGSSSADGSMDWTPIVIMVLYIGHLICAFALWGSKSIQAYMADVRKKPSRKRRKK